MLALSAWGGDDGGHMARQEVPGVSDAQHRPPAERLGKDPRTCSVCDMYCDTWMEQSGADGTAHSKWQDCFLCHNLDTKHSDCAEAVLAHQKDIWRYNRLLFELSLKDAIMLATDDDSLNAAIKQAVTQARDYLDETDIAEIFNNVGSSCLRCELQGQTLPTEQV